MITEMTIDQAKAEAFTNKLFGDMSAATATFMASMGDRLGLWKALNDSGPATSVELAKRTGLSERYLREWLSAVASAGYIDYDPMTRRFTLLPENALALADESSPFFLGGLYDELPTVLAVFDKVAQAFRTGGGVNMADYDARLWQGMERETAPAYDNFLTQNWIAALPDVQSKLERGALVADVGCGSGRALIRLAQAFPNSRFVGYDSFRPQIARATANSQAAGVAERVRFENRDVAVRGLSEQYDLITTFDVVHDAVDPLGLLRGIRQGLKSDGTYLMREYNVSDKLEENIGPIGTFFYGVSVLYCMTTSLAHQGAALGTAGLPESKVREFAQHAGFTGVRRVPIEDPFSAFYDLKP